ncbi:MAG TPA: sigma-70 family RNA polymerase sigma factor [Deltaproteobacteria bacterium]|nr:sigma-70 family RNA polymerase sigma factor [Deltaproteobacteria bacterium]
MEHDEERKIIDAVLAGDRQAFARLVDAHKTAVFNLAFRMTGDLREAEDLAQESFLRAYRELRRFDANRPFFAWLYTITLNLARSTLRKQKARESRDAGWQEGRDRETDGNRNAGGPEAIILQDEEQERLQAGLLKIPTRLREAVVLRFYDDRSFDEIAVILGISTSAAKMRVYRGLEKLRKVME